MYLYVGINFNPFSSNDVSALESTLSERLQITVVLCVALVIVVVVLVQGTSISLLESSLND